MWKILAGIEHKLVSQETTTNVLMKVYSREVEKYLSYECNALTTSVQLFSAFYKII